MFHRGEVEVVKCIWKTFTLIPTCYLVARIQAVNWAFRNSCYCSASKKELQKEKEKK